jgi:hypothetical protein
MAGKGRLQKTDAGTWIFQLVVDGKIIDSIEVDELEFVDCVEAPCQKK